MRTRSRTREIGRLESEIRLRKTNIDELNSTWLHLVEKEVRGVVKARYLGKIVSIDAAIKELEWKAVKGVVVILNTLSCLKNF